MQFKKRLLHILDFREDMSIFPRTFSIDAPVSTNLNPNCKSPLSVTVGSTQNSPISLVAGIYYRILDRPQTPVAP